MTDIFKLWGGEKRKIHERGDIEFYVNEREIWFTKMGINIGYEENGKKDFFRPVLVLKKVGNLFFTVALTSKGKLKHKFYHKLRTAEFNENNTKHMGSSFCILSQAKVMDKKRFTESMGIVSKDEFSDIKKKLRKLLL